MDKEKAFIIWVAAMELAAKNLSQYDGRYEDLDNDLKNQTRQVFENWWNSSDRISRLGI